MRRFDMQEKSNKRFPTKNYSCVSRFEAWD